VQSKRGKGDLANRMFEYFYKIYDKYKVPITAIAILADGNKRYHPCVYKQEFMGTRLTYEFNCYKILNQDEHFLRNNLNPFAVVVLTSLMAIKHKDISDEELKGIKHDLYDEMMKRKMEKPVRQGIYDFLAYYVSFENPQILRIFEQEVENKLGRNTTMGTREYLLEKARKEERTKIEAEILMEKLKSALEFKKMGVPVADIAKGLELPVEEVEKLK